MKRNILYTMCLAFIVATVTSCDSFLDRQEDEKLTFDKIWESRYNTQQYWLNTMSYQPNENGNFIGDTDPWIGASDEGTIAYDRAYRKINFGTWNASDVPYYQMDNLYNGIRECTIFMQNVDRCSDPLVTKDQLAQWKVQTRFMRAYYYFLLMRMYGPVFLLGDELLDFTATTEELQRPRNTWDECVDYVVSELNACIADPAMTDGWRNTSEYGLATKGACEAVVARLQLYSARDLFNGNKLYRNVKNPVTTDFPELSGVNLFPQDYKAEKWVTAARAAKKLIDNPLYKLYRAGNNNPYEDYCGVTLENWNSEIIWTDGNKNRYYWGVNSAPTSCPFTAYGAVGPTQQQVDAYAMNNGRYPITGYDREGNPQIDLESGYDSKEFDKSSWTYPSAGWSTYANYSITAPNMYKNREPRFYVTVFFSGNYWLHGTTRTMTSFAKGANGNKSHDYPKSGYLLNRFFDHKQNQGTWGTITFPVFRLGEMYLNFIESVLEAKRLNVSYSEKAQYETLAFELWDDLRDRAGLPSIKTVYPGASTEEYIELCRKERRVELAFERHRYFDTRTWMIAKETDGGPMYGMDTTFPTVTADGTPDGYWNRVSFETRVFKDNHYLYPFSQRELDRNKLLTQNYGW